MGMLAKGGYNGYLALEYEADEDPANGGSAINPTVESACSQTFVKAVAGCQLLDDDACRSCLSHRPLRSWP